MAIWSENVFKESLLLQFSWLEEFRYGELQYENGLKNKL